MQKEGFSRRSMWVVFGLGAIWGSAYFSMRSIAGKVPPEMVVFIRLGIAGVVLLFWTLATQRKVLGQTLRSPVLLGHTFLVGVTNFLLPFLGWATVAKVLPSSMSAMINGSLPVFGSVYAYFFLSEKLEKLQWLGIFLGFLGVLLLAVSRTGFQGGGDLSWPQYLANVLIAIGAVNGYAYTSVHLKKHLVGKNMLVINAMGQGFSAIALGVILWTQGGFFEGLAQIPMTWEVWLHLGNLGLLCSAIAFVIYFSMLDVYPASIMLSVAYWVPVMGAVYGISLLGEKLSVGMLGSFLLIFLAQSCVHRRKWVLPLKRVLGR